LIMIGPPLIISEAQIDEIIEILDQAISMYFGSFS
jgi:4-aminobutyrate aminotransferase-like enzyme